MLVVSIEAGRANGIGAAGSFAAGVGDVLLIDLARPLAAHCAGIEARFAILPPWLMEPAISGDPRWHGIVLPAEGASAALVRTAVSLAIEHRGGGERALCASLAALVTAALSQTGAIKRSAPAKALSLDITSFIEANLADRNLSAARLAREFGMARASLYRQFDSLGGIAAYVRRLRLRRAREVIERSGGKPLRLSAVAAEVGFASPTVFARAFRQAYGMSPRECLRRVRPAPKGDARSGVAGG